MERSMVLRVFITMHTFTIASYQSVYYINKPDKAQNTYK